MMGVSEKLEVNKVGKSIQLSVWRYYKQFVVATSIQ